MAVEVVTPEEYMGDVMGDLNRRRGMVGGMEDSASGKVIMLMFLWLKCLVMQLTYAQLLKEGPHTLWSLSSTQKCRVT